MPYEIFPATAENIVKVVDCVNLKSGCNIDFLINFIDITEDIAVNTIQMAKQLSLIEENDDTYKIKDNFIKAIITPNQEQKSCILRFYLENYPPYQFFKSRLYILSRAEEAAQQTKLYYNLRSHRQDISNTLVSLGTYTFSLTAMGAGNYRVEAWDACNIGNIKNVIEICEDIERARQAVTRSLTTEAYKFIHGKEIFDWITNAYRILGDLVSNDIVNNDIASNDTRDAIFHAGNAIESFLDLYGQAIGCPVNNVVGINNKVKTLKDNNKLTMKHSSMGFFLGHYRNGADHGNDIEIGSPWRVRKETSVQYVLTAISFINNVVAYKNSEYFL